MTVKRAQHNGFSRIGLIRRRRFSTPDMTQKAQNGFGAKRCEFIQRDDGGQRLSLGYGIGEPKLMLFPGGSKKEMLAIRRATARTQTRPL